MIRGSSAQTAHDRPATELVTVCLLLQDCGHAGSLPQYRRKRSREDQVSIAWRASFGAAQQRLLRRLLEPETTDTGARATFACESLDVEAPGSHVRVSCGQEVPSPNIVGLTPYHQSIWFVRSPSPSELQQESLAGRDRQQLSATRLSGSAWGNLSGIGRMLIPGRCTPSSRGLAASLAQVGKSETVPHVIATDRGATPSRTSPYAVAGSTSSDSYSAATASATFAQRKRSTASRPARPNDARNSSLSSSSSNRSAKGSGQRQGMR